MALLLTFQLALLASARAYSFFPSRWSGNRHDHDHRQIITNIRLPPVLDPDVDTAPLTWTPMPTGFWYGPWHVAHSSNKKYQALHDLVWSLFPGLPTCGLVPEETPATCPLGTYPGQLSDLSTWFVNSSSTTYVSAFGYDTPRRVNNASAGEGWVDVWDTVGNGALSYFVNGWQIIAWGWDGDDEPWMLNYETAVVADETPACLDILSRVAGGPDEVTVQTLRVAVKGLGNDGLSALFEEMELLAFDHRREWMEPFACGPDCVNNTDVASAGDI